MIYLDLSCIFIRTVNTGGERCANTNICTSKVTTTCSFIYFFYNLCCIFSCFDILFLPHAIHPFSAVSFQRSTWNPLNFSYQMFPLSHFIYIGGHPRVWCCLTPLYFLALLTGTTSGEEEGWGPHGGSEKAPQTKFQSISKHEEKKKVSHKPSTEEDAPHLAFNRCH